MKAEDTIKNNLFTYKQLLESRSDFRRSGGPHSDDFNLFDTPGVKYFKVFFYFNNGDSDSIEGSTESSTGLLAPTWELPIWKTGDYDEFAKLGKDGYNSFSWNEHESAEQREDDKYYHLFTSAWAYLKMNYEDERADQLKQFVNLLSNISTKSPWYFSEISGLDAALERKQTMEPNFKFEEERKKITIKCLPDAYDNRIGTLLDLYRSIVWSWKMKRAVLPANLRKFDMGIFIFNDPVAPFTVMQKPDGFQNEQVKPGRMYKDKGKGSIETIIDRYDPKETAEIQNDYQIQRGYAQIGNENNKRYKTSYKYIELHNCEIDYNSSKTPWATVNNTEGVAPQYNIDILFDDCYEYSYNEFNMKSFGDMILWDMMFGLGYVYKHINIPNFRQYEPASNYYADGGSMRQEWLPNQLTKAPNDRTIIEPETLTSLYDINAERLDTDPNILNKTLFGDQAGKRFIDRFIQGTQAYDETKSTFMGNMSSQLLGTAKNIVTGVLQKAVLGNLYTFSLSRLGDQLKSAADGNIWTAIRNVDEYITDAKQRDESGLPIGHSLFSKPQSNFQTVDSIGNIGDNNKKKITKTVKSLGSLNNAASLANNV